MHLVHTNTDINLEAVKHVANASIENSNGTKELVEMVQQIKAMADQLAN